MKEDKSNQLQIFIIVFNCKQDVETYEEIAQLELKPIDGFEEIIQNRFKEYVKKNGEHLSVIGPNYKMYFGTGINSSPGKDVDIYGEQGLYEMSSLAKERNWTIYDKGLKDFINFDFLMKHDYLAYKKKDS